MTFESRMGIRKHTEFSRRKYVDVSGLQIESEHHDDGVALIYETVSEYLILFA